MDTKKGRIVAALVDDQAGGGKKWVRARIEGKAKTEAGAPKLSRDGYELLDVTLVDSGDGNNRYRGGGGGGVVKKIKI